MPRGNVNRSDLAICVGGSGLIAGNDSTLMERPSSSSSSSPNEEDDRQNLLDESDPQIDATEQPPPPPPTFDVESLRSRFRRSFSKLNLTKRQCIVIFLPLLLVFLYLSTHLTNYFSKVPDSVFRPDHEPGRTQEPDLRAFYLLRKQETDLSSLWNRTLSISDIKSALFRQISLNRQIQNALLSPHKTESLGLYGGGSCGRVDQRLLKRRKTIQWKPRGDKFLFAICLSGQMSNHLICLEKHMFFAALLKRVLVIPSRRFDYHYSRIIDIDRINTCLGRKVVVSFEEFWKSRKKHHHHVHIDRFICYFSKPEPCYVDKEHFGKLKGLGISIGGKVDSPWGEEDIKKPSNKTAEEVERSFRSDDDVIAIGDVFYASVEREWVMQPGGPLAHKCKTLVEPNRLILLTAQRFIQTFLGKNYVALHFRRHGFLKFCNAKNPSCFFPIPQAAHCIARLVEKVDAPVIYLSTDAAESETGLLQSLLIINGKTVPFVKRPPRDSAEKWDALLYRHGLEGDSQVEAMLDKTICAMSSVFIGASGSTFTEDILRLRKDWGTASNCDEYLCQNEQPNFIADHE